MELQHWKIKAQWMRTNMREAVPQMTCIGDIGDALDGIYCGLCYTVKVVSYADNKNTKLIVCSRAS